MTYTKLVVESHQLVDFLSGSLLAQGAFPPHIRETLTCKDPLFDKNDLNQNQNG